MSPAPEQSHSSDPVDTRRGPDSASSLEASAVRVVLGEVVAVDGVDLVVAPGRSVALVGESGAGKTTLLRCFNRMAVPSAGAVRVAGVDVARLPAEELRRRTGYVQQQGGLLPHWRVLRNVMLVPTLLRRADAVDAARSALALVGLPAEQFGQRFPGELSGGQRQRAALARAIAARPGVLLMDEPFSALDAISRSEVQAAFADLRRELGITTLFVTHDLLEADFLADTIVVMRAGRVEQRGTLDEMLAAPETSYVAELLERALAGARRLRE
ncbi:MAG: ATP-binding cassette domain-containing protein [Longimicrobiales bacterium]